jgi:hypothetical protein
MSYTLDLKSNRWWLTTAGQVILETSDATAPITLKTSGTNSNVVLNTLGTAGQVQLQTNSTTRVSADYDGKIRLLSPYSSAAAGSESIMAETSGDYGILYLHTTGAHADLRLVTGGATADITVTAGQHVNITSGVDMTLTATDDFVIKTNAAPLTRLAITANGKTTFTTTYSSSTAGDDAWEVNCSGTYGRISLNTTGQYGDIYITTSGTAADVIVESAVDTIFYNGATPTEWFRIEADGQMCSYGNVAPDVDPGGLALGQGALDGFILTLKSTDVNHPFPEPDADTYGAFRKMQGAYGGLGIFGYNDYTSTTDSLGIGLGLYAYTDGPPNDTSTSAYGCIHAVATTWDGAAEVAIAAGDNIMAWRNYTTTRMILKGSGQLYNNYATSMTTYDTEDDIALARATQLSAGNRAGELSPEMVKKLQDLGVFEGEFGCLQKIQAVELGAITQLWNMVRGLGERLGVPPEELLSMAKEY